MDAALTHERLKATRAGLFGVPALLLAAAGVYGVVTYAVNRCAPPSATYTAPSRAEAPAPAS